MQTINILMHLARAVSLVMFLAATVHADSVLFDNGGYSGPQESRNASGPFWVADDFVLAAPALVTAIEWSQHDELRLAYTHTNVAIYRASITEENLVVSFTAVAERSPNGTAVQAQFLHGFDYRIGDLAILLPAERYWLALNSHFPTGGATWDQTAGTLLTAPGRFQFSNLAAEPPRFWPLENSAFRVMGAPPISVPEPAAAPILLALAACIIRMRRHSSVPPR